MANNIVGMIIEFKAKQDEANAAFSKIEANLKGIEKQNNKVNASTSSVTNSFTKMGSVLAGLGAGSFLKSLVSEFGELGDQAAKLRVSAESLSILGQAAKEAGVSQDTLSISMSRLSKLLGETKLGVGDGAKSLDMLGLSMKDFENTTIDQSLLKIVEHIRELGDTTTQNAVSFQFFGRSFADMSALMSNDFRDAVNEIKSSGSALNDEQIRQFDKLDDRVSRFWFDFKNNAAKGLLSFGDAFANRLELASQEWNRFTTQIRGEQLWDVESITKITRGLTGAFGTRAASGANVTPQNQLDVMNSAGGGVSSLSKAQMSQFFSSIGNLRSMGGKIGQGAGSGISNTYEDNFNNVLNTTTTALKRFRASVEDMDKIGKALKQLGESDANDIINRAVQPRDIFGNMLQELTPEIKDAWGNAIHDAIEGRQSISSLQSQADMLKSNGFDNSGVLKALESLQFREDKNKTLKEGESAIADLQAQLLNVISKPAQVDLKIDIEAAEGFIARVVQSPTFSAAVDKSSIEAASRLARVYGVR